MAAVASMRLPQNIRRVALLVPLLLVSGLKAVLAGCPNQFHGLDERAQQATDAFNSADASSRCATARELVSAEQTLDRFVEEHQIQCVLDQEIIDVQRRRLVKAKAARDQVCAR